MTELLRQDPQCYELAVIPVMIEDAERAAEVWQRGSGPSLADRLCLALGRRLQQTVVTCDSAWAGLPGVELLR